MMQSFMSLMQEQIFIAKENCKKNFSNALKENAKLINELK